MTFFSAPPEQEYLFGLVIHWMAGWIGARFDPVRLDMPSFCPSCGNALTHANNCQLPSEIAYRARRQESRDRIEAARLSAVARRQATLQSHPPSKAVGWSRRRRLRMH